MTYTASMLSFMFENLSKSIILTGSQIPISEWRNDAHNNLLASFEVSQYKIPEVVVVFNRTLMRGNRCSKVSAS